MESNFNIQEDIELSELEIKAKKPWYKKINWFKVAKFVGIFYLINLLCINTLATIRFHRDISIPFLNDLFSSTQNKIILIISIIMVCALILVYRLIFKKEKK